MLGRGRQKGKAQASFVPQGPGGDGRPDRGFLDNLFNQSQMPSVIKEFVHPGKDPGELLMRCVFKDAKEANAAILYLAKCEEFNLARHKRLLLHKLAATTSIGGERVRMLLQAVTGIISPEMLDGSGRRKKREREDGG